MKKAARNQRRPAKFDEGLPELLREITQLQLALEYDTLQLVRLARELHEHLLQIRQINGIAGKEALVFRPTRNEWSG